MERETMIQWSEIEPLCVLRLLLKQAWMIVLAALIGVMAASIVLSTLVSRSYSSSATFVVTPRTGNTSYYINTSAAADVAAIYSELLQSNVMSQTVHETLEGVTGSISAYQLGDTNLIRVTATSESPRDALLLIQAVVEHYPELSDYVSSTAVLSVLDTPSITSIQTQSFNESRLSLMAGLGCAGLMAALLVWLSISSGTVQNTIGAKNNLDAKILATVPHEKSAAKPRFLQPTGGKRLRTNLNISSPAIGFPFVESIHRIASKIEHEHAKDRTVFLFSSVSEAEGKSTLAANTALSLAQKNYQVLFIDLDLRRPVQNQLLGLDVADKNELGALLAKGAKPETVLNAVVADPVSGLSSLLSTKSYTDMIELISSPILAQTIQLAREQYDYVIIDSPPLGYFADSELLSDLSDASILVVRQDVVSAPEINDAIDALRAGKAEFLGCILNDMRHLSSQLHGYGYGSGYGYGYGYGYGSKKYGKYGYGKYGYGTAKSADE